MLLLASAFFLTLLQCSDAQNKTSVTPADCNTIETDAGVALDLVNRHHRDGYVFALFRVADAHELHIGNSSVLTLDVLETERSVLSRRQSCEYSDTSPWQDFGQCKIITYTSQLLKKPQLYGFNCTLSPVPSDLLECKDCPMKVEVLEVTEQHKNIAAKALEKLNKGNHTNYFDTDQVKILKMTASHEGHILGFSIEETNCSKSAQRSSQLECDFLDDWHTRMGFRKARIISNPDEPDGTDTSCEICHPWQRDYGQRCRYSTLGQPQRHPHRHHHFGHRHRHRHHHRHGCPPSSSRPEDPEHNHSFNEEHQDSHEGPAPPPPPPNPHRGPHHHLHPPHHCPPHSPHGGPHHHPPPPPHDGPHPLSQEEPQHPPSAPLHHDAPHPLPQEEPYHPPSAPPPRDEPHHPPPSQEELHHLPSPPPPHDELHNPPLGPHHGPHCPSPPHGPHHPYPPPHHRPHCPLPPPPPHGPHHHHAPLHRGPHCPPPPPHRPHHHHPPHHRGPHHPPPPGHPPYLYHHYYRHHCNKTSMSGKYFPFITGAVYCIPVLNQDSLTPPTANFPELSQSNPRSSSTAEGVLFTGSSLKEMPEGPGFPDHPTQSKSCPGNPKLVLPKILPLFPHSSMAENSPT
ncbi:LOW QUALITY PROTEIN: histidine-rich glycoprotein [Phoenicopterus ruber ruber]